MGDRPPPLLPSTSLLTTTTTREGEQGLRDQDDEISLSTFESTSFDVTKFVTQLMNKDVQESKSKPGPFNPEPHLETLEKTLSLLLPLRKSNALKISSLEKQVLQSERVYKSDVRSSKLSFESVCNNFLSLDSKINSLSRNSVRIGEQLESIDKLKQRAQEAHDLILYYNEFSTSSTQSNDPPFSSRLEQMKKEGGREGRYKVAIACRRLLSLSKEVDQLGGIIESNSSQQVVSGSKTTRESIERYCEKFEKDLLKLFDKYYRRGDPKSMAHVAKTLQDFNGGQSCIQIYVNQHDFFISKDRVQEIAAGTGGTGGSGSIWENLPNPDCPPPKTEPGLSSLFDEIRVTVGQEAQIVSAVFPNPLLVMKVFLQRVFQQVIQGYLETLLSQTTTTQQGQGGGGGFNSLAYLRILYLSRNQTNHLVEDLKNHEFFKSLLYSSSSSSNDFTVGQSHIGGGGGGGSGVVGGPSLLNPLGNGSSGSGGSGGGSGGNSLTQISQMLDQSIEELFIPYMEGTRYLEKESKNLIELFAFKLSKFTNWHRSINKTSGKSSGVNTIFDRMVTQFTNAAHQAHFSTTDSTTTTSGGAAMSSNTTTTNQSHVGGVGGIEDSSRLDRLMKFSGLSNIVEKASSSSSPVLGSSEEFTTTNQQSQGQGQIGGGNLKMFVESEKDGELSLETSSKILEYHSEALGRMVELSPNSEVPKNAFSLLKILSQSFCKNYLELALDTAISRITVYSNSNNQDSNNNRVEPNLSILLVLKPLDMIIQLWQRYISTALIPLAGTSVTVRREMSIFVNHVSVRIEGKVNQLLQKMLDSISSYINSTLVTKQKKLDFKPKNDDLAFSRLNTEPCLLVCDFLNKVQKVGKESLSGRNREVFLTEVGVTFHTLLLDHFKKFSISATGGLMLTKDLALYQDTISTFSITVLNDRFEMLRQLGNVFIVQPEILSSYLNEASYLSRIENRLLRPFVMMRSDFGDFNKKFWDEILGDTTNTTSTTTSSTTGDGTTSGGGGGGGGFSRLGTLGTLTSLTSSFGSLNSSSQNTTTTTTTTTGNVSGGSESLGRKQSLFGNLMKDFEGLGLRDDTSSNPSTSEFGSKRASMISGH
ncbi:hypothetical protein JCM3765_006973 [Sporobolomyces pararoseus]